MAAEEDYVRSISFFRTHPPFYERIIAMFSGIKYLPKKAGLKFESTRFHDMKRQLKAVHKPAPGDPKKQPKLRRLPVCDDEEPSRSKTGEF